MFLDLSALVVPMALALGLGVLARKTQLLTATELEGLKKLICTFLLPFVVLNSFSALRFDLKTLLLPLMSNALNLLGYLIGKLGKKKDAFSVYKPYLLCSMEASMMGYALFSMVFGVDKLPYLVIFDAGQAIFFFLFYLPQLQNDVFGKKEPLFPGILKQPIVWALTVGLILSLSGAHELIINSPFGRIWQESASLLGAPVSCVMLFVVGYGIQLNGSIIKSVGKTALQRIGYMLPISLICALLIHFLGVNKLYGYAILLFCAMPPSYLLPVYVKGEREQAFVNSLLSLYVLYSIFFTLLIFALQQIGA